MKCTYCKGGPDPGWMWTENNGPIVACPVCNPDGEKDRIWEMAELQRSEQLRRRRR